MNLSPSLCAAMTRALPSLLLLCFCLLAAGCGGGSSDVNDDVNAVYTETNAAGGNAVAVFHRATDGTLSPASLVPTGGLGTGGNLGNQGAVALDREHHLLFAVNAGSDEISVFAVAPSGISPVDRVASGGDMPVSLTVHDDFLYVLNAGSVGNITGFTVAKNGKLTPLSNSTRALSTATTGAAQVSFSPGGNLLVVTEKATRQIDTYVVGSDGRAVGPTPHPSSGATPFGFGFDGSGHLIVSEAAGSVSSYAATSALPVISASVATHQAAPCWIAVTDDGNYAYAANAGSASITGFRVAADGGLTLLNADGITVATGGATPVDMAFSRDGRYLYALLRGSGTVGAFAVGSNGSLTSLGSAGSVPTGTTSGLAAW